MLKAPERSSSLRSEVLNQLRAASTRDHLLTNMVNQHPVSDHQRAGHSQRLDIIWRGSCLLRQDGRKLARVAADDFALAGCQGGLLEMACVALLIEATVCLVARVSAPAST
jgi:hypothetical protein